MNYFKHFNKIINTILLFSIHFTTNIACEISNCLSSGKSSLVILLLTNFL